MLFIKRSIMMPLPTEFTRQNYSNDMSMILENPLFQALLATGEVIFDRELELIKIQEYALVDKAGLVEFRIQLQELHELIEHHAGEETRLKYISLQNILSFVDFKPLYMRGILTLDEILSLSLEQMQSLERLQYIVSEGIDAEQKSLNRMITREEQMTDHIYDMLQKNIISKEDRFTFPVLTDTSPSLCALIINGKISLKQAQLLTPRQKINMSGYNTYYLILADIITVKQVLRLTCDQLFHIERLNLREIKADPVLYQALGRVVQEEAVQYLKNTKNPQTSQSFMFFNHMMKHMERTHITEEVWFKIKERVSTRLWDRFHFLFSSCQDPSFVAKIEVGQSIKLSFNSEIQAPLASSEGYREYCRHTMFSSRLLQISAHTHAVLNETAERPFI